MQVSTRLSNIAFIHDLQLICLQAFVVINSNSCQSSCQRLFQAFAHSHLKLLFDWNLSRLPALLESEQTPCLIGI